MVFLAILSSTMFCHSVVADHHDGDQLQVTRGFQTQVATKLEQFLDR